MLGAVLPATMLRGDSTLGFREFLMNNYNIEFIIIREDRMNFSEDTDFREILLVAKKGGRTDKINYIMLEKLNGNIAPELVRASHTCRVDGVDNYSTFQIRKKSKSKLDIKNLFRPISLTDYRLIELIDNILGAKSFVRLEDIAEDIQSKDQAERGGPTFAKFSLNAIDTEKSRSDYWQIKDIGKRDLDILNIKYKEEVKIPKFALSFLLRRIPYRDMMDISSIEEYVIRKRFEGVTSIMEKCNVDRVDWRSWQAYLDSRTSNLSLIDRFDITAPGTSLMSYYSEPPRVWARIPAVIRGLDNDTAKCLCLWFNSSIGLIQLLSERMETRGGWMQFHKFIMNDLRVPYFDKPQKKHLLAVFNQLSTTRFPSLVEQFALLTAPSSVSELFQKRLSKAFDEHMLDNLGKGFPIRRKIDEAILNALGWKQEKIDSVLEWLYPALLKEILVLKEIMSGREELNEEGIILS